ncbi:DUF4244 domain-containing protein [Aeromicrobium sp. 50.2.37]|uniref:DUF4244 domain-containing protein n=1 Tax=Aeromicrobium sp. 50.2.37 TaxID=2969305 RepID=UPI00214F96E8|nr:DUF4244 domain-containing protein [Aeromicrobium sp. 50.2.37]MCR4513656.1 DUF4244 domain-containing protein [Aeromicrobium sp. 50.2.37]
MHHRTSTSTSAVPCFRRAGIARSRDERGMTTAEYAVGTLGAATCAAVLVHLGADGWFFEQLREIFVRALDPTTLVEHLRRGRPWTPIG